ncbi:MAG: ornithine carbamoyltransferase [Gammaproteobacteria bacterium]|nr:ornithine carbamoyltransferase [Gammaproteobacteria bacterium]
MHPVPHFISLHDLSPATLAQLILRAGELKQMQQQGEIYEPLKNRTLAMVFEKASTRTRVSFEAAMTQLGGHAIFLSPQDTQLGRGEPLEDAARVLSRMVDAVMVRTFSHSGLQRFAEFSDVPVINALTDTLHPCQLLADMQTFQELRGAIAGKTVAWIGDGNNMCNSYIEAALQFNFNLKIATPKGYEPNVNLVTAALRARPGSVTLSHSPQEAVSNADLVSTDVWASMGQESQRQQRLLDFKGYMVDEALMTLANPEALFLHCLPAHRGEEVSHGLMACDNTAIWQQAGNRLHTQKALLEYLLVLAA